VQNLPAAFRALGDTLAAARRVFAISDETPTVVEAPDPVTEAPGHDLTFEGVRFRYRPELAPALDDISFELPAGATVAVIGPSGAGKSSLAQLLLRFHVPEAGTIRLAGRPIEAYALKTLRTQFAW